MKTENCLQYLIRSTVDTLLVYVNSWYITCLGQQLILSLLRSTVDKHLFRSTVNTVLV